jgi:uncharacterized membrane protein
MATWKRDAASGLIVLLPLIVTAFVILWLYGVVANVPFLEEAVSADLFGGNETAAEITRVVLTLVVFVVLVFSAGYMMRTALGRVLEAQLDDAMNRVPILRVVYNASKMAVETALGGTENLQRPVKLETWDGLRMTAFKTGRTTEDGREMLFLPTAPNITTGFVIEVEPENLQETGESVEDALTRIISAGFAENERDVADIAEEFAGEDDAADEKADNGDAPDDR